MTEELVFLERNGLFYVISWAVGSFYEAGLPPFVRGRGGYSYRSPAAEGRCRGAGLVFSFHLAEKMKGTLLERWSPFTVEAEKVLSRSENVETN